MHLTAKVKLKTTPKQFDILKHTMLIANDCCNWLSGKAQETRKFHRYALHKVAYYDARKAFPKLSSQAVIRCESKVGRSYEISKTKHAFKPLGAIEYDSKSLTWCVDKHRVSIWSINGRLKLEFYCGQQQLDLLQGKIGQSNLILIGKDFYLYALCAVEEPRPINVTDAIGVDFGIVSLVVDSDGDVFSGKDVEKNRRIIAHRRRNLRRKQTKTARRKLKKLVGKQSRYQKNTNHVISKQIVQKAQGSGRAIAIEDLTGIQSRVTVRRKQRAQFTNWSYYDLRQKIEYKAQRVGIPVIAIDPKHTSQECSVCGHIAKANRPNQSTFLCKSCGYAALADFNAARIIRARAIINKPNGLQAKVSTPAGLGQVP